MGGRKAERERLIYLGVYSLKYIHSIHLEKVYISVSNRYGQKKDSKSCLI